MMVIIDVGTKLNRFLIQVLFRLPNSETLESIIMLEACSRISDSCIINVEADS